jgi:hypothetical protein
MPLRRRHSVGGSIRSAMNWNHAMDCETHGIIVDLLTNFSDGVQPIQRFCNAHGVGQAPLARSTAHVVHSAGGDGSSASTPNDGDVGACSSAQPPKQKEKREEQGASRAVSWWRWLFSLDTERWRCWPWLFGPASEAEGTSQGARRKPCSQLVAMALQPRHRATAILALALRPSLRSRKQTMGVKSPLTNYASAYCWMRGARHMDVA